MTGKSAQDIEPPGPTGSATSRWRLSPRG